MQEQSDQTRTGVSNSFGFTGHIRDCETVYLVELNSIDQKDHSNQLIIKFQMYLSCIIKVTFGPRAGRCQGPSLDVDVKYGEVTYSWFQPY